MAITAPRSGSDTLSYSWRGEIRRSCSRGGGGGGSREELSVSTLIQLMGNCSLLFLGRLGVETRGSGLGGAGMGAVQPQKANIKCQNILSYN